MGRTGKWLRSIFSISKNPSPPPDSSSSAAPAKEKKKKKAKWALPKSGRDDSLANPYSDAQLDANKHAIAVAAATAAVAEAALAAAQAAAEVVRLTSGGASGSGRNDAAYMTGERRRVAAAVKIQAAFRAYLARRALRALKGLVKLQALVRGHIVRKQSTDMLRRMQAMARIQARASAHRSYVSEPMNNFSHPHHLPSAMNRRHYRQMQPYNPGLYNSGGVNRESSCETSNWLHHWMDQYAWKARHGEDERTDKILEIDTWKPHQPTGRTGTWNDMDSLSAKFQKPNPSVSSEEVLPSPKYPLEVDHAAENSARVHSALSRQSRGVLPSFTPTKSECSRSLFGDYLSHPNYMANTASSRAKVRSQSAPKQRMQLEELGMSCGLWEPDTISETGNYRGYAHLQYSGQLRRQGTPARGTYKGFSSNYGYQV